MKYLTLAVMAWAMLLAACVSSDTPARPDGMSWADWAFGPASVPLDHPSRLNVAATPVPAAGGYANYWTCSGQPMAPQAQTKVVDTHVPCGNYKANGCYMPASNTIEVRTFLTPEQRARVVAHEALHRDGCSHPGQYGDGRDLATIYDLKGSWIVIGARGQ